MYTLKKSLGQHFLHDENICNKIVAAINMSPSVNLLEIGPGGGALSKYLLEIPDINYRAVEIDDDKVSFLKKTYPQMETALIHEDFLRATAPFEDHFSVVGNFPYNISSQILFKILDWKEQVDEVVGMFQKEVAERVASVSGNKIYGILSVLVQAFYKVEYLFDVNPNCFTPPPKVMSGVIRLTSLGNPYEISNYAKFKTLVKMAFSQRRKTLRNALKPMLPLERMNEEIFNKRAEQLSVAEFVSLYKNYLN